MTVPWQIRVIVKLVRYAVSSHYLDFMMSAKGPRPCLFDHDLHVRSENTRLLDRLPDAHEFLPRAARDPSLLPPLSHCSTVTSGST